MTNFLYVALATFLFVLNQNAAAAEDPYFSQLFAGISGYLEEGEYEKVLEALPRFSAEKEFKALTCYQKGRILHKIGVAYYLLDREQDAIRCFRDSVLAVWRNCPEVPAAERANTIYNIGICYQYLGDFQQAKRHLDEALLIFENAPDYAPFDLARKYQGIANFYRDNFDSFRAGLYYENALSIFRRIEGTEALRFDILNSFLILSIDRKDYEKAEMYFDEAMALYRESPESIEDYDLSILYQNAGICYVERDELDKAMENTRAGLSLIDPSTAPALYSNAIEKIAVINRRQKQFARAIEGLNEVVRLRKANLNNAEDYQQLAYAYENLFEVYKDKGDPERAGAFLQKAFETLLVEEVFDDNGAPVVGQSVAYNDLGLVRLLSLKAQLLRSEFQATQSPAILEKSLSLHAKIDSVISKNILLFQFQKSKLNFLELVQGYYGDAIRDALKVYELSGEQKYLRSAYFFSSKTKAIILRNELKEANAFQSAASPEIIEKEKALAQKMFTIQEQLSNNETGNGAILRQYVEVQREMDRLLLSIEREEPAYFRNKYAFISPPGLDEIQKSLPEGLAIIEYFYRTDTIYSFWITRSHLFHISIDNNEQLEGAIRDYVNQCHDPNLPLSGKTGHFLYEKLIAEGLTRKALRGVTRLCIIPDDLLHTIPFEALNSAAEEKNQFLIKDYSVAYSYSAGLLVREKSESFDIPYLGVSTQYTPDLSGKLKNRRLLFGQENLSQLVLGKEEIDRGAAIFAGRKLLDQQATLGNFYAYASSARIIHLSLHGLVDFDDPLRSCILFDDHREEFVLSAFDLYSLKINANLVVLSACHSANGKIYRGEGVQGISKAFMLSGAQTILSSLWSASEASSLEIMTAFLRNIKNRNPNDLGLHQAKLDYLANARPSQQHPFYWANFIIIGELNSHQAPSFPAGKIITALALALVIGLLLLSVKKRPGWAFPAKK
ncbi:MAG: CHAT domain-containing protein [Lewinellaceae bacterium]|nr:CHAT domain-containing protein [Lewinellaceae bacterium]